jgi:hypothetical protein
MVRPIDGIVDGVRTRWHLGEEGPLESLPSQVDAMATIQELVEVIRYLQGKLDASGVSY